MVAGVSDLSEMPPYTHRISLARHVPMAANGTWSATVLAHRPQQCLLLSRRGPDAQRWRRVEAAGRPRRRSRRLHSRRHASLVLNCPALARCNSISCYRILKERVEPKCLAGRQLPGNCFVSALLHFTAVASILTESATAPVNWYTSVIVHIQRLKTYASGHSKIEPSMP